MSSFVNVCTILFLMIACSLLGEIAAEAETVTVMTTLGEVEGRMSEVSSGTERFLVSTFYGIPYARPPIGELRFKPPLDPKPWVGKRSAFEQPNSCVQVFPSYRNASAKENFKQSEDCLYLNVIVPVPVPEKATVMVWIYGGAFSMGSVVWYDFRKFAAKQNVILVAMNYRVSSLGFLYLGDEECPGNVGLLDQQLALKWVRENIERFGGDPDKVTIFGQSAGSASVGHHLLNPESQKYFRGAIMQSGSPYGAWVADSKKLAMHKSIEVAIALGCEDTKTKSLITCLRKTDPAKLVEASARIAGVVSKFHAPVFDNEFVFEDRRSTINSLREKRVMLGFTSHDGAFLVRTLLDLAKTEPKEIFERTITQYVGETTVDLGQITQQLVKSIKYYYKDHCNEVKEFVEEIAATKMITDNFFACPSIRLANALAEKGVPTFLYQFHHKPITSNTPSWVKADHSAEIPFLLGNFAKPSGIQALNPLEHELSQRIMDYWGSFAKSGDPDYGALCRTKPWVNEVSQNDDILNPNSTKKIIESWPQYTVQEKWRLDIDLHHSLQTSGGVQEDQCKFWRHDFPILIKGRS